MSFCDYSNIKYLLITVILNFRVNVESLTKNIKCVYRIVMDIFIVYIVYIHDIFLFELQIINIPWVIDQLLFIYIYIGNRVNNKSLCSYVCGSNCIMYTTNEKKALI